KSSAMTKNTRSVRVIHITIRSKKYVSPEDIKTDHRSLAQPSQQDACILTLW
ncbi:unnamed protein product, partial [Adineta steineri]